MFDSDPNTDSFTLPLNLNLAQYSIRILTPTPTPSPPKPEARSSCIFSFRIPQSGVNLHSVMSALPPSRESTFYTTLISVPKKIICHPSIFSLLWFHDKKIAFTTPKTTGAGCMPICFCINEFIDIPDCVHRVLDYFVRR